MLDLLGITFRHMGEKIEQPERKKESAYLDKCLAILLSKILRNIEIGR
jgi:hypothetical protein